MDFKETTTGRPLFGVRGHAWRVTKLMLIRVWRRFRSPPTCAAYVRQRSISTSIYCFPTITVEEYAIKLSTRSPAASERMSADEKAMLYGRSPPYSLD